MNNERRKRFDVDRTRLAPIKEISLVSVNIAASKTILICFVMLISQQAPLNNLDLGKAWENIVAWQAGVQVQQGDHPGGTACANSAEGETAKGNRQAGKDGLGGKAAEKKI